MLLWMLLAYGLVAAVVAHVGYKQAQKISKDVGDPTPYNTPAAVIVGVLWPLTLIVAVVALVMGKRS